MGLKDFQEDLGKETLLVEKAKKAKISSGIREFDEMIGGGFTPASLNLVQESLGCGGDILCYCFARANLNLANKLLIIFSDPLTKYLVDRLKKFDEKFSNGTFRDLGNGQEYGENLYILDLVKLSEKDISLMEDRHELQLKISSSLNDMLEDIEKSGDDLSEKFIIHFSINPYLLKLGQSTLDIVFSSLIEATKSNYVQIMLMQKDIISRELTAKIQSLCHLVCDLSATEKGGLTENFIKILKHAGTIHDIKAEPYIIDYDRSLDRYNILIRGAFLTTFETIRNLFKYHDGSIYLANVPYLIAPVNYFNTLLEMPLNISMEDGKKEIHIKSQAIGRRLTATTQALYFLQDFDLLKATLRSLALFGFGNPVIEEYEEEENLLVINFSFQKDFHERSYRLFLKGLLAGVVRKSLKKKIKTTRIVQIEMESDKAVLEHRFNITIQLQEIE